MADQDFTFRVDHYGMDEKGKSIAAIVCGALFVLEDADDVMAEAVAFVEDGLTGVVGFGIRGDLRDQGRAFFFQFGEPFYQCGGSVVRVFDSAGNTADFAVNFGDFSLYGRIIIRLVRKRRPEALCDA